MSIFTNLSANQKIMRRISELEAEMESLPKLSRDLRALDLEFTTLYGKVRTMMGRIEKRAAILENEQGSEEEATTGEAVAPSDDLVLTPEQLKWQKRIATERRRLA